MAMNAIYFDKVNGMQKFIPAQKILLALSCWKGMSVTGWYSWRRALNRTGDMIGALFCDIRVDYNLKENLSWILDKPSDLRRGGDSDKQICTR